VRELPEGWAETTLGAIADVVGGGTPDTKESAHFSDHEGYPWLTPADLSGRSEMYVARGRRFLTESGLRSSSATLMPKGTVLLSSRAPIGYVAIAANEISTNQGFKSFICRSAVLPEYLYFWLKFVEPELQELGSGSTFREISGAKAKTIPIRIAPLAEQRRIVNQVDGLLRLVSSVALRLTAIGDELVLATRALSGASSTGAAISAEASGTTPLETHAERFDYGTSTKSAHTGTIPVLRMGNIADGEIDWTDLVYTSDRDEIAKYALQPGDVLFNRTNSPELVGKTAIYRGEQPAVHAGYLIRVRCREGLLPEFLNICLNSPAGRAWCNQVKTDGVSQSNINASKLKVFPVPVFSVEQQRAIVEAFNRTHVLITAAASRARRVEERVRNLRQSILQRAFAGELVPTEADLARRERRSYQCAQELLERIRAEGEVISGSPRTANAPRASRGARSHRR
jgi:type I restriction enzyme, S subunit